jgi:hypothetical protein
VTLAYLRALGLTLVVEVPIVMAFYRGQRLRLGATCCVATTLTHAALFLLLFRFVALATPALVLGEVGALALEAVAYAAISRPTSLSRALMASSAANAASFGLGLALL